MKHQIRDSIIFLIHTLRLDVRYRSAMKKKGPLVRVLCFHDVADAVWFEKIVSMVVNDFHVVTPEQFHAKTFREDRINILLTFDDGYASWVTNCHPILTRYEVKGLFFVNSGLLDAASDRQLSNRFMSERLRITPKDPLTWEGTQFLLREGHSIGGHTKTHADLASLEAPAIKEEITLDKSALEQILQRELTDFAFPFGTKQHITPRAYDVVAECGFTHQYAAISGFWREAQDLIPRTLIEKNQSLPSIKKWILGGYDIFNSLKP
jgi:peptidoglycan/xylan/chitin deacetylase (PgdA/CDA1 family)